MKAILKLEDVDSMVASMTITMTLGDWKILCGHLGSGWPECDLRNAINALVGKASVKFVTIDGITE